MRREHDGLLERKIFPAMEDGCRSQRVEECAQRIDELGGEVAVLEQRVGDPETACDELGYLPAERRPLKLVSASVDRQRCVEGLRSAVKEASAQLASTTDRKERSDIRHRMGTAKRRLDAFAVTPIPPEEMCADCYRPSAWHGGGAGPLPEHARPCPAWPRWAARIRKAWDMINAAQARIAREREQPKAPKPAPLAVVESGLPLDEVIPRLQVLQAEHPTAVVRRGRANRWELWAPGDG